MKKHILSSLLFISLLQNTVYLESKNRSWREIAISEKEGWAHGLAAARKKLWDKEELKPKEQMYFDALQKRLKIGIPALLVILATVYGIKKFKEVTDFPPITDLSLTPQEKKALNRRLINTIADYVDAKERRAGWEAFKVIPLRFSWVYLLALFLSLLFFIHLKDKRDKLF